MMSQWVHEVTLAGMKPEHRVGVLLSAMTTLHDLNASTWTINHNITR